MIDSYTPLYRLLLERGIRPHEADMLDLTTTAILLGITAEPEPGKRHVPSWWRGDSSAASSSVAAARQLGFVVPEVGT